MQEKSLASVMHLFSDLVVGCLASNQSYFEGYVTFDGSEIVGAYLERKHKHESRETWRKCMQCSRYQHQRFKTLLQKPKPGFVDMHAIHCSTSGHRTFNQAVVQESSIKSFQCSHCTLILKSKAFLFEHLNKVHGFDVDIALRNAGLKNSGTIKASIDNSRNALENKFECQHCGFKACDRDILNEHEKKCKKSEYPNVVGNLNISENPETKILLTNQHKEATGGKEISSALSVMPTSKTKCKLKSSNNVKTYQKPLHTITKYFAASSSSKGRPAVNLAESTMLQDNTKGTLILQESPPDSSPNKSGVFKVTAKPTIDITKAPSGRFLMNDHFLIPDPKPPKSKEKAAEIVPNYVGKRNSNESPKSPPTKKSKLGKEENRVQEKAITSRLQSLKNNKFSFEFSEDEEEYKVSQVNQDTQNTEIYFCKHCDYSGSVRSVSTHYQNDHPYIRFSTVYIEDPSDQSATFRCLECPVEFPSGADLKRHHKEHHPEAPNVFTMESRERRLVFKCFVCPFTTNVLKVMKDHYQEKHPTHKVDNPLIFCRYLVTRSQEEKIAPSPERPQGIPNGSAKTSCKEVKNAPSPQHSPAKGADLALYHCRNCEFSHKSVVVMHVHYQKSHPEEQITIDKIKQSNCVMSHAAVQMSPDKSPDSVTKIKKSTSQKNMSDSSEETRNKTEVTQQTEVSSSLVNPKHTPNAPKTHSESAMTKKVESSDDKSKGKKSPNKRNEEMSAGIASSSCRSPSELFYCQFCNYSNSSIKSVVGHHNAKHSAHAQTGMEEILRYSAAVPKKNLQSETETSARATFSDCKSSKEVEICSETQPQHEEDEAADALMTKYNAYACAENLFYCRKCNYGNPSIQGVLTHQARVHQISNSRLEQVIEYTALIRDEIEKSKSQVKELSFLTHLPLPLLNEGDENMFFCHFCNYRQSTVNQVLQHYSRRHCGFRVEGEQVHLYTSMVLRQAETSQQRTAANQEVNYTTGKEENINEKTKKLGNVLASPSITASQTQRTLQCYKCSYTTQNVNLLRKHMFKIHKSNRTAVQILKVYFKQGTLRAGYHCNVCVFSHTKATAVYKHYQEQHTAHRVSLEYITTKLYVGPETQPAKKKKSQIPSGNSDSDGTDGSLPSQRSRQNEIKTYSCRACSFKGSSVSSITRHYRAVHPWSVKEDGSVLDVINSKKQSANKQLEDDDEKPGSFNTNQVGLEFDSSLASSHEFVSSTSFKCPLCPAVFFSQRGLSTHTGMKHQRDVAENVDEQQEQQEEQEQIQTRVHVFKCPHCTYVNTNYQGVLTHCQMRHPALESRADSLYLNEAHLQNWEDCLKKKGPGLRLTGYMCNTCQQICATLEKLDKHREKSHNGTMANTEPKTTILASKVSAVSKKKYTSLSNKGTVSKASFLSKKKYAVIRCQYCSYVCPTKLALGRHLHVHHKNASATKAQDSSYKCALCSSSYFKKKFLGSHYANKHGKKAFLKYYVSQYQQVLEKQMSTVPEQPLSKQLGNSSEACNSSMTAEENKKIVFKCPSCPYVNASFHGILTHCQMKHPEVVARAHNLQTDEILLTNMVECTMGKGSNERGYMCKKCPQIHVSLKKLKIHCEKDHNQAEGTAYEDSVEAEKQPDHSFQGPVLEADPFKTKSSKVSSTKNKKIVFKCPSCPYVNVSCHGLFTHWQLKHPEDVARAHNLQTDEILLTKMVGYTMGKRSGDRGYICKKCPQIYVSLTKLQIHCEKDHDQAEGTAYEDSIEAEKQLHHGSQGSVLEAASLKTKSSKVSSTDNQKLVFKCPSCPYVNVSCHGLLTHCQMKHPEDIAKAHNLQTDEILLTKMVGYAMGKGSSDRGFMCKKCPQIHVSLKKLQIHCDRDHDQAEGTASQESVEAEKQLHHSSQGLVLEAASSKTTSSAVSSTEIGLSHQMGTPKTYQSILSLRNKELLYKCHICSYVGSCRKYLHSHYKKTHKFDAFTTCRLLQRYNKYNRAKNLPEAKSDQSAHIKCKICPNLKFNSSEMLISHYNTFHSSDGILNFIVLSKASKKSTGLYKCALCKKQMNGTRKLWHHLDSHREGKKNIAKTSLAMMTTPETKSIEPPLQNELLMLETVEDLAQWNVTPVETFTLPSSPLATPSKDNQEQPELEPRDCKQTCKQCGRQFMSLKGLRSHERSHAALAAIKKKLNHLSTSETKREINKYIIYKPGTIKPLMCSLCSYRTTFMGLWRSHFMKKHQDVNMDPTESDNQDEENPKRVNMEPPDLSEEPDNLAEPHEEPEVSELSLYSEPPDVQRQLNHYSLVAKAIAQSEANVQETKLPRNSLLDCEFCNFNTGHLSSMRRHYLNRHGKKILRCKDCDFFTGTRRTLEMHMESGHSTCQSEPTHQKDLHCPFCLYQTKNKNNMIDHIVLHREERVVPIEVRRSKLSRYLQGIVFRCHKCTFTSGSAENLRLHMMRHDDIKPYKCRLCYFDSTRLNDLEAHLSDKHQVVRNHELVGQISLDQLEARVGRMSEEEGEPLSDLEHHNNDSEDVKTEEIFTDCDEVPHEAQAKNLADSNIREIPQQIKEAYQWQSQDYENGNEERPAKSSVSELQYDNAKPNSIVQKKHVQDPQEHAEIVFLHESTARRQGIENRAKQKVDEVNNADIRVDNCNYPEKERWTNESQAQPKLRDSSFTQPKEEAAEGSSTCSKITEKAQAYKLHFKALRHKALNIEARIEDDILRHILLLDEDGSIRKIHKKEDQERTVKIEQSFESDATDNIHNVIPLLDEDSCITLAHNRKNPVSKEAISVFAKKIHGQANNARDQERFTVQRHWLTLSPNCRQLKISHKEISGVSFTNCKEEQVQNQKNHEEIRCSYEEMPVLENEYLKEELHPVGSCKEEDQDDLEPKQDKEEDEMITEDENQCTKQKHQDGQMKEAEYPHAPKGVLEVTDGEAEVLCSAASEEKMFTCEFCGRNLMNSSELERHRMRHGI